MSREAPTRSSKRKFLLVMLSVSMVLSQLLAAGCIQRFNDFCEAGDGKEEGTVGPLEISGTRETASEVWTDGVCIPNCTGRNAALTALTAVAVRVGRAQRAAFASLVAYATVLQIVQAKSAAMTAVVGRVGHARNTMFARGFLVCTCRIVGMARVM
jgi:hypothetical protein